jgi:hypothetical protein
VAPEVQIFGPFNRALQDDGETLEVQRPDTPDTNGVPYITVESVRYASTAHWPWQANGTGASVQRLVAEAYGNDPANWFAAVITPGIDNTSSLPPALNVVRSGPDITLFWSTGVTGCVLESADQIPSAVWDAVSGISNNSVMIVPSNGSRFYRLRKP